MRQYDLAIATLSYQQTLVTACEVGFAARAVCQIGGVYVRIRRQSGHSAPLNDRL